MDMIDELGRIMHQNLELGYILDTENCYFINADDPTKTTTLVLNYKKYTGHSWVIPGEVERARAKDEPQPRGIPTTQYPNRCDNRAAHYAHDDCPGRSFDQT